MSQTATADDTTLAALLEGESAEVTTITLQGIQGQRLHRLGFVSGTTVKLVRKSPLGDPREYEVRGTRFCLRKAEAHQIRARRVAVTAQESLVAPELALSLRS